MRETAVRGHDDALGLNKWERTPYSSGDNFCGFDLWRGKIESTPRIIIFPGSFLKNRAVE